MSHQGNATEVEKNSKTDEQKSESSLKRPASEVNDAGKEDSNKKLQKTDKGEKPNGVVKHKEEDDEEDVDSKDEDEDDLAGEGEGEDFDEEEGDDDVADEEGDEDDEDDA